MNYQQVASNWDVYDYETNVLSDVKDYIINHAEDYTDYNLDDEDSKDKLASQIQEDTQDNDDVTGNGSGSYTMSRMMADLFLVGNSSLYAEALEELGGTFDEEPENRDIVIRCYLLPRAIEEALEDDEVIDALEDAKNN
jgi:hypothetical protein